MKKLLLTLLLIVGCARGPIKSVDEAMRSAKPLDNYVDDMGLSALADGIQKNIEQLERSNATTMRFGPFLAQKGIYLEELKALLEELRADPSGQKFYQKLNQEYDWLEVYGGEKWGQVFVTSYYEPVIKGSSKRQHPFTQALYEAPEDMLYVDMSSFVKAFPELQVVEGTITEKTRDRYLRGRLIKTLSPVERSVVVPYFSREEIETQKDFYKQAKVICYVDPVDAFFLQIQGSGVVQLKNGQELRLGYAGQNGHSYQAIGRYLFDVIPKEEMSMQKIEAYLRQLPEKDRQKLMNLNPSYVFFQKSAANALTYFGVEAVAGRTIATDTKFFPKGALAFLEFEKPNFVTDENGKAVVQFVKAQRFVLDQDTGGAIRGPHRVDLFSGRGAEAGQISGVMRNPGRLFYLLPKKSRL